MFCIRLMRKRAGYTQAEVAEKLGVSSARYSQWEREDIDISLKNAVRLSLLFECSVDELVGHSWPHEIEGLSLDETGLVSVYRAADERGRGNIMAVVERELEHFMKGN
jgi:transcriptional regulator with XRE-family HTH domain